MDYYTDEELYEYVDMTPATDLIHKCLTHDEFIRYSAENFEGRYPCFSMRNREHTMFLYEYKDGSGDQVYFFEISDA